MSEKPIWERVTFLEANYVNFMKELKEIKNTMNDFIKEIKINYATKQELNEVKDKICQDEEESITKEVAGGNNRTAIIIVVVQWIIWMGIALIGLLK